MKSISVFILTFLIFFTACEKAEEFSEIPEIKFTDFKVNKGDGDYITFNGILTFSFADGDGDIGVGENVDSTKDQEIDVFILKYYLQNDTFKFNDTIKYWMPYLEEGVYRKSATGSIDIILPQTILSPDTVKYEFYILDRANHMSNKESTPEIIYSELSEQ